jgi:MFS family permease
MVNDIEDVHSQRTAAGRPAPLLTLVFVLAALSSADLSVIVPSLSAYVTSLGGGVVSYGLILAAFNVGEVLATPLWSYWVDRRSVLVMLTLCVSLSACGGLMYFLADHSLVLMGVGRLVAGFGAANTVVAYSTITRVSRPDGERQFRMSLFTWMTRTMQVVGPGIGLVGVHLTGDSVGDVRVNEYNFAILVLIVAYGAFLLVALFFVVAAIHNSSFERLPRSLATDSDVQAGRLDLESGSLVNGRSLVLLLVYFVLIAAYWSFAAAVFPFGHDRLHWHLSRSYYFFIFLGCVFLAAFALLKLLHRCLDDFPLLVAALALSLCGSLALLRFGTAIGTAQVAVSGGLLVTGLCFGSVIVPSLVAEMAGLQVERLGSRMSWFFAITSLARTAGPLYGALLIRYGHLETIAIVGACMAALALIVLLTSSLRDSAHAGGPAAGAVDESARAALLDSAHMPAAEPKPAAPRRASTLRRGRYEPTKLRSVRGEVLTQDASTSV